MNRRGNRFEIDQANGKWLGVCAGLANQTGVDVIIFRIGFVVATLLGAFPWTFVAYGIAYFVGRPQQGQRAFAPSRSVSREEARDRLRGLDLRMQAIETHVTSSNSRLAREIEDLR
jgi:phage shock protein C